MEEKKKKTIIHCVKRQLRKTEKIFTKHIVDSGLTMPKIFLYIEKKTLETVWEGQQAAL